jgi:hypothetical protein
MLRISEPDRLFFLRKTPPFHLDLLKVPVISSWTVNSINPLTNLAVQYVKRDTCQIANAGSPSAYKKVQLIAPVGRLTVAS